ncbi:MAG: GTPase Era [Acidimicrobiales bacterium]
MTAELARSGFVTLIGRPNVGKSTLVNAMVGSKISIVSNKPQTTRRQIRGVLNREDTQLVFIDTPGIHRPKTPLGERLNSTAASSIGDVDVVCIVFDVNAGIGPGDRFIAQKAPSDAVVILNKCDSVKPDRVAQQLELASAFGFSEYFPVSAETGKGLAALVDHLIGLMPAGPQFYPDDMVSDLPDAMWVAELVREQLNHRMRDELPHSIATRVTEWELPRIRVEILVERDSQKGMVIGKKGAILKAVGTAVRKQLVDGVFLELVVSVDKNWQSTPEALERLDL